MLRRVVALAASLTLAGCGLVGPPQTGPDGLSTYAGDLRRLSSLQRFDEALIVAEERGGDAGDELLAALNQAAVEHYAGRYEDSNARLQAADLLIEERFTKSVSRAALSLVSSDRALAWVPTRGERLMVHVYGALNYVALDDPMEAAVEARRLSMLLDQMADDDGLAKLSSAERDMYASLRYLAGTVFELAGERNDADVAYRKARFDVPILDVEETSANSLDGSVVVVVESGFVAHRVERSTHLLLGNADLDGLRYGSEIDRRHRARCLSQSHFSTALDGWRAERLDSCPPGRRAQRRRKSKKRNAKKDDELPYLLRVAWPSMSQPAWTLPVGPVQALAPAELAPAELAPAAARDAAFLGEADEQASAPVPTFGSLEPSVRMGASMSGVVEDEFVREAPEILVKSIVRAAVKYAAVDALEDGARKEDETLGDVVGILGNAAAALTERADTRSWTMLPADVQLMRLDLPAGSHDLRIVAGSRELDLGTIEVRPGRTTMRSVRIWP